MTSRIESSISTILNPFGPDWNKGAEKTGKSQSVGEQVQDALFGHKKPTPIEDEDFPELKAILKKIDTYRRKFVMMMGDDEKDYRLQLALGTIAMIDAHGTIYVGKTFLEKFKKNLEVPIGAIAHEVGHRPQRWAEYKAKKDLNIAELQSLCRYEETRADLFAGRALAETGLSCEPMIKFLEDIEEGPHPEYFPAKLRAQVIREGFNEQSKRSHMRRNLWPEFDQGVSARYHLGDY